MKLIIIPSDKFVSIDGLGYFDVDVSTVAANVHAVQWFGEEGWIEYVVDSTGQKPANETIYSIEQFQDVVDSWEEIDYNRKNPPPPPPPTIEQNKTTAMNMLSETDWVEVPSVSDPNNTPHLTNKAEFDTYRLWLRAFAVNPEAGEIQWPVKPVEVWE